MLTDEDDAAFRLTGAEGVVGLEMRRAAGALAASEPGTRTVRGYAAVYNKPSGWVTDPKRPGKRWREVVAPGAFDKAIQEGNISLRWSHDPSRPLANQRSGTLRVWSDDYGVAYEAQLGDSPEADNVLDLVRRSIASQMSFGFKLRSAEGESWQGDTRRLIDLLVPEISIVENGTWSETSAQTRERKEAESMETIEVGKMGARALSAHMAALALAATAAATDADRLEIRAQQEDAESRRAELLADTSAAFSRAVSAPVRREIRAKNDMDQAIEGWGSTEYRQAFDRWCCFGGTPPDFEKRDLISTVGSGVLAPKSYKERLLKYADTQAVIRTAADLRTGLKGNFPARRNDQLGTDYSAAWTTEAAPASTVVDLAPTDLPMVPEMAIAESRPSTTLLQMADYDVESEVIEDLSRKVGKSLEWAYCQGTGSGQPKGAFIYDAATSALALASAAHGSGTGWDAGISYLNLVQLRYKTLPASCVAGAAWYVSQDALWRVMQLLDNNGRPMFTEAGDAGASIGFAGRMLGLPVSISEFGPTRLTAAGSNVPIMVGNMKDAFRCHEWGDLRILRDEFTVPGRVRFVVQPFAQSRYVLPKAMAQLKITLT